MEYKNLVIGVVKLIKKAEIELPNDVIKSLKNAYKIEKGIAKIQIENILKNIDIAKKTQRPLCQDTGLQTFFVKLGKKSPYIGILKNLIIEGVKIATKEIPLRPNTVDPFTQFKDANNIGDFIPDITWDFVNGSKIEIIAIPKGAGSENMSKLKMLNPSEGLKGVKKFVIEEIIKASGNPCPPTVIGIGIGGGADLALYLGKKALIRPVGMHHHDKKIASFEEELKKEINKSGIGPMGLGGKTTVLDVHIEKAHRHPASLPVGLIVQCWANRRANMIIHENGEWEVR
ncbi:MAG: fumarate hydratase [Thermoplasmatota archaeon]|jgi:fumarate hydratase subunit alpha